MPLDGREDCKKCSSPPASVRSCLPIAWSHLKRCNIPMWSFYMVSALLTRPVGLYRRHIIIKKKDFQPTKLGGILRTVSGQNCVHAAISHLTTYIYIYNVIM
jgi:hypothetical protein